MSNGLDAEGGHPCPEYCCPLEFNEESEVVAHLEWDHNRSEYRAKQMVKHD